MIALTWESARGYIPDPAINSLLTVVMFSIEPHPSTRWSTRVRDMSFMADSNTSSPYPDECTRWSFPQEIIDIIVDFTTTSECIIDYSLRRVVAAKSMALAAKVFVAPSQKYLFRSIRIGPFRLPLVWDHFFNRNPVLQRYVQCIELHCIRAVDVPTISRLVGLFSVGPPLVTIKFVCVRLSSQICLLLAPIVKAFPRVTFKACSYDDSDVVRLLSQHRTLASLSIGMGFPGRYKGHSLVSADDLGIESASTVDPSNSDDLPPHLTSYFHHMEHGPTHLMSSPLFHAFLQPQLRLIGELFMRVQALMASYVQKIVHDSQSTLFSANIVIHGGK